jgi:hypothetical protein
MSKKIKADLMKKIHGAQICQVISTAVRIGLAEALNAEPKRLDQLTSELQVDSEALGRLIGTLMTIKIIEFADDDEERIQLTEEGQYLIANREGSLAAIAAYKGSPLVWKPLGRLEEGIKTGKSPFLIEFGQPLFDHLRNHPEDQLIYQTAMACYEHNSSKVLFDEYPMLQYKRIIDLGGGLGGFIRSIRDRFPEQTYALMDLKQVVERAKRIESNQSIEFIEGDFFESVPEGYDCYMMRNILHDWSDELVIKILKNVAMAMVRGKMDAKLLVFETLIEPVGEGRLGKFADLSMFTQTPGGKERSEEAFRELFAKAGLSLEQTLRSSRSKALMEVCVSNELNNKK